MQYIKFTKATKWWSLKLLLSFVLLCLLVPEISQANTKAPKPPGLKIKRAKTDQLKLVLSLSRKLNLKSGWRLEIERKAESQSFYVPLFKKSVRGRKYRYLDQVSHTEKFRYRVRLSSAQVSSVWRVSQAIQAEAPIQDVTGVNNSSPGLSIELPVGFFSCSEQSSGIVLDLVNQARIGLPALTLNEQLQWSAINHALKMARDQALSHDGWYEGILASGFVGHTLGQNIASSYPDASALMNAWLASDVHRGNILGPDYRLLGVGCVIDPAGRKWWVQNLAG